MTTMGPFMTTCVKCVTVGYYTTMFFYAFMFLRAPTVRAQTFAGCSLVLPVPSQRAINGLALNDYDACLPCQFDDTDPLCTTPGACYCASGMNDAGGIPPEYTTPFTHCVATLNPAVGSDVFGPFDTTNDGQVMANAQTCQTYCSYDTDYAAVDGSGDEYPELQQLCQHVITENSVDYHRMCACQTNIPNDYQTCDLATNYIGTADTAFHDMTSNYCSVTCLDNAYKNDFPCNPYSGFVGAVDYGAQCQCIEKPPQPFLSCITGVVQSVSGSPEDEALCQACLDPTNFNDECQTPEDVCRCEAVGDILFSPGSCYIGAKPIGYNLPGYSEDPAVTAKCQECFDEAEITSSNWEACTLPGTCQCEYEPNTLFGAGCPSGIVEPTGFEPGSWIYAAEFGIGPATQSDCDDCLAFEWDNVHCSDGDSCRCVNYLPNLYDGCPQLAAQGTFTAAECDACLSMGPLTPSASATACSTVGACRCVTSKFFMNETCALGVIPADPLPDGEVAVPEGVNLTQTCALCDRMARPVPGDFDACSGGHCVCHPETNLYAKCQWLPVNATPNVSRVLCGGCASDRSPPLRVCTLNGTCQCGDPPEGVARAMRSAWKEASRIGQAPLTDPRSEAVKAEERRREREGATMTTAPIDRWETMYHTSDSGLGSGLRNRVFRSLQQAFRAAGRGLL